MDSHRQIKELISKAPTPPASPPGERATFAIAVLDDSPFNLKMAKAFLEKLCLANHRLVIFYYTFPDAKKQFSEDLVQEKFQAIISDYHMKSTTGLEVAKEVREWSQCIPIIINTSDDTVNSVELQQYNAHVLSEKRLSSKVLDELNHHLFKPYKLKASVINNGPSVAPKKEKEEELEDRLEVSSPTL